MSADIEGIVARGAGNPRQLLAAARDSILRTTDQTALADRLLLAAAKLGSTETFVMRHLLSNRPTSASDEEFLHSLGVTRARATQVLRRLEGAGLVSTFHDKAGVGRPRKLYVTNLDGEDHR